MIKEFHRLLSTKEKLDLVVIGGGLSGLLICHFASKAGFRVQVLEAADRVGGWVNSQSTEFGPLEWGPHTILADQQWMQLFSEIGLEAQKIQSACKNRYIFHSGKRHALQQSPLHFLQSSVVTWAAKLKLLPRLVALAGEEPVDESVQEFFEKRLSKELTDKLIDPFCGGIYAGDIQQLSMKACFPDLWRAYFDGRSFLAALRLLKHQKRGSKKSESKAIVSFNHGLEELVRAVERKWHLRISKSASVISLDHDAGAWQLKFHVLGEQQQIRSSHVVVTTPAFEAANLLKAHVSKSAQDFLESIAYQKMGLWNCVWNRPPYFETGLGCLVPRSEGLRLRGSLWPSEMFKGRAQQGKLVSAQFFSGSQIPSQPEMCLSEVQRVLQISEKPVFSEWRVFERAIPQFGLGHMEKVQALRGSLPQGLYLAGNYLDGVGLSAVMKTAKLVFDSLSKNKTDRI